MQISDFLAPENIELGLSAPSKQRLLQTLAARAAKSLEVEEATILAALVNREKLGSTGMGRGIAIPHATLHGMGKPFGMLVRLAKPVDFDAVDETPVDIVFLLLGPASSPSTALGALSCMARALRDDEIVKYLRSAEEAGKIYDRFVGGLSAGCDQH